MVETKIIAEAKGISYEGIFNLRFLISEIDAKLRELGYTINEKLNKEDVNPKGKSIEIVKEAPKKVRDFAKYVIEAKMNFSELKEKIVERSGSKQHINQRKASIIFSAYLELDYAQRWEKRPIFYFLRSVFDTFVWKVGPERLEAGLAEEVSSVYNSTKSFLKEQSKQSQDKL